MGFLPGFTSSPQGKCHEPTSISLKALRTCLALPSTRLP